MLVLVLVLVLQHTAAALTDHASNPLVPNPREPGVLSVISVGPAPPPDKYTIDETLGCVNGVTGMLYVLLFPPSGAAVAKVRSSVSKCNWCAPDDHISLCDRLCAHHSHPTTPCMPTGSSARACTASSWIASSTAFFGASFSKYLHPRRAARGSAAVGRHHVVRPVVRQ